MWSEELDKKIQEAAANHSPAYDEKAWEKMEDLLDEHLPQDKKRRRFLFFWLIPILLGAAAIFLWQKNSGHDDSPLTANQQGQSAPSTTVQPSPVIDPGAIEPSSSQKNILPAPSTAPAHQPGFSVNQEAVTKQAPGTSINSNTNAIPARQRNNTQKIADTKAVKPSARHGTRQPEVINNGTGIEVSNNKPELQATPATTGNNIPVAKNDIPNASEASTGKKTATTSPIPTADSLNTGTAKPSATKKSGSIPASRVIIGLSAGPDLSAVGLHRSGTMKMQYGIGIGYKISPRFTIRSGFFVSRKIYTATPVDYHSPYPIPNLEKVDANCLVYEIPLNMAYEFGQTRKHSWLVSAGASSYIMKEETYGYLYKNGAGQNQYYEHSYSNRNKHIFSIATLSGGYRYHFNDRLSLTAEPYVKVPVTGIGLGKVKLNSGGVLLTIGIRPFPLKNK